MTLDEINQKLADVATSGDAEFAGAAQYIQQMIQQIHAGQMTTSEATELLGDIQKQLDIVQDMGRMALKETMHTIITGLITIASAAA